MIGLKPIEPLTILWEHPRLPYQQGKAGQNCLLTLKEKPTSSPCSDVLLGIYLSKSQG